MIVIVAIALYIDDLYETYLTIHHLSKCFYVNYPALLNLHSCLLSYSDKAYRESCPVTIVRSLISIELAVLQNNTAKWSKI